MTGIFYGIGVGPGDPELLTMKAIKTLEKTELVVNTKTLNALGLTLPADLDKKATKVE